MEEKQQNDKEESMLKRLGTGLFRKKEEEKNSIGKDMHLMMQEFTQDKNVYRLTTLKESEVADRTMQRVMAESENFPRQGGRFKVMESWTRNECMLRQSMVTRKTPNLLSVLKDFGGYMLAFRGGVEWRQAGIMGDSMMDEQQKSLLGRVNK